ncbi:lipopolysaccharide-induced tumor necrosis factor-alpha factor homolog [Chelmon rostratus]|uniref:lipopolysaccharide-induced tumor necrosis factor-alpha factor homolog n=1 Tax=Chelmon rostratus TaxID=109905 RepID=UPI001BEA1B23|nr:lipopolysaccharide-induced tumor necrosis factor-alpha factor homolog [Chelmon rostratus]
MTSSDSEQKISAELKQLSLMRQQLLERKKIQCIFQELRNRAEFGQAEGAASNQHEIDSIDDKLKQLTERKAELQKSHDNILHAKDKKEDSLTSSQMTVPVAPVPASNMIYIEAPPSIPAPTVILDLENFPPCPCRTQCPACEQFIVTETFTSVSSLTWLVCFMIALTGCAAGCCLIPFCIDTFKSTTHKCPRCRTSIITIKKL